MKHLQWAGWCLLLGVLMGCSRPEAAPETAVPAINAAWTYVGDETCASCHEDLYASYHMTGMGQSVSAFDPTNAPEQFAPGLRIHNPTFDYFYEPLLRDGQLVQRELRLDENGEVIHEREHVADLVIGSGNATRSYLMNVNGHVTQMPLTWYVEAGKWDLSPGYEQQNFRFSRPISNECMTCHNGIPEHSEFSTNHYTEVPNGITCERCHGPASEHVEQRLEGFEPDSGQADPTLVNIDRLDRDRQLSVCQQCHLTGFTVFKEGQDMASFRPGEMLRANRSVFVIEEQQRDPERFGIASHAERLALSACFDLSAMTCTTCHDPHQPVASLGPDVFNQTCTSCHGGAEAPALAEAQSVCGRPDVSSRAESMTGNCVSCHMQKSGTSDIPHVTFTDHWIRRTLPPAQRPADIERMNVRTSPFTLVRVDEATPSASTGETQVEEAIAYYELYETMHTLPTYLPRIANSARLGIDGGGARPEAYLVLGKALVEQDSLEAARTAFAEGRVAYPEHARLAYWLGAVALDLGDAQAAVTPLTDATAMQPAFLEAQLKLAETYAALGQAASAESILRSLLAADSLHHPNAWNNLGFLMLNQQNLIEAQTHFEQAVALDPDLPTAWVNLASVFLLQEQWEAALEPLGRAVALDQTNIAALGNLGVTYMQLGEFPNAILMFEQVLQYQPGDPNARAFLQQARQMARDANS